MNLDNLKLTAKTLYGFEDILADELLDLGARNIKKGNRSVNFEGDLGFVYKANYNLHTAIRILVHIKHFRGIKSQEQLYTAISRINWEKYLNRTGSFAISVSGQTKYFNNTQFLALKSKDAIADQFRKKYKVRPNIDLDRPDLRINLHFKDDILNVSLDSSGDSLHKRNYRSATNIAPINEVLAAGIVKLSGWDAGSNLIDPMCGSGTILIEAAMLAMRIPANINRKEFGFEKWSNYNADLFELIKTSSLKKIREISKNIKLIGYDKAPSAVEKAIQNVKNANLDEFIKIKQADFFKTTKPEGKTSLIFNPPYDERLSINTKEFYKNIGDTLKHRYSGSTAWFITGNLEALKSVGLRPSKRIPLFNAKIEARLVKYEMYQGSRKNKF